MTNAIIELLDVVLIIIWAATGFWALWKILDDLPFWTKHGKPIFRALIGTRNVIRNKEGKVVRIEYEKGEVTAREMELAGKTALAMSIVVAGVFIGLGVFFGFVVLALNLPHAEGWSLF